MRSSASQGCGAKFRISVETFGHVIRSRDRIRYQSLERPLLKEYQKVALLIFDLVRYLSCVLNTKLFHCK